MTGIWRTIEQGLPPLGMRGRRAEGPHAVVLVAACLVFAGYVFAINSFLLLDMLRKSALFAGLLLALVFLACPGRAGAPMHRPSLPDYVLVVLALASGLYIYLYFGDFIARQMRLNTADIVMGLIAVTLALEAARRAVGIWMAALAVAFLLYALYGRHLPGQLAHFGVRPERLLLRMYLTTEGMYGQTLQIAQTFITLFVFFGAFLKSIGTSELLNQIGLSVSGRYAGGPAKVAVVGSGFSGMISGSAAANVATTGTISIPMMKRAGFSPGVAGGIEAVASTGGMIMPPIMGAAAFLMVEFANIPYPVIMAAAIVPALLYFTTVFLLVHVHSIKRGISGLPPEEIPSFLTVARHRGYRVVPIVLLVWLMIAGYTPTFAVSAAIVTCIALGVVQWSERLTPTRFLAAIVDGAIAALSVSTACLAAGFIVGVVNITGVGQVFANNIFQLSGGILPVALVLTGVASIILSAALPATAVYIVVVLTVAPALVAMDVPLLAAHFFIFYFGNLSNITPPIAIACFTAAGIAGTTVNQVAWNALKLALPVYAIIFTFVYHPSLLFIDWALFPFLFALVQSVLGIVVYILALEGYGRGPIGWPMRASMFGAAFFCLLLQGDVAGGIGLVSAASLLALTLIRPELVGRRPAAAAEATQRHP